MWTIGSWLGGQLAHSADSWQLVGRHLSVGLGVLSEPTNSNEFATLVLQDVSRDVLLYCPRGTAMSESAFWENFASDSSLAGVSALVVANCSRGVVVDTVANTLSIHSFQASTQWALGWDSSASSIFLSSYGLNGTDIAQMEYITLRANRQVTFPLQLFRPNPQNVQQPDSLPQKLKRYSNEEVSNLAICAALSTAVGDDVTTLILQSDLSQQYSEYSLAHWVDLCGLNAVVVHTYTAHERTMNEGLSRAATGNRSFCTVRYVTGIQPRSHIRGHASLNATTGKPPMVCLEDVLSYVYSSTEVCTGADTKASCATKARTSQHSTVTFLTSLHFTDALTGTTVSSTTNSVETQQEQRAFDDVLSVLRAFANTDSAKRLIVRTIEPTALLHTSVAASTNSANAVPLTRRLLNTMLVFDADPNSEQRFSTALSELKSALDSVLVQSASDSSNNSEAVSSVVQVHLQLTQVLELLDALMTVFGSDFLRLQQSCVRSTASYLCAHNDARHALATLIVQHITTALTPITRINGVNGTYVALQLLPRGVRYFNLAVQRLRLHEAHSTAEHAEITTAAATNVTKPHVQTFVDGDVHVLIFVRPEHVYLAQRLVAHWQRSGAEATSFLYVRYTVIPIHDVREGSAAGAAKGAVKQGKVYFERKPSLRAVLRLVKEKIEQVVTVKDVVYVLNGLQALLSFPQPGKLTAAQVQELQQLCEAGLLTRSEWCDDNVLHHTTSQFSPRRQPDCNVCKDTAQDTSSGPVEYYRSSSEDRCEFLTAVVPSIPYGGSGAYGLRAKIVFAAQRSWDAAADNVASADAFVGLGHTILHMINWVQRQPQYTLASTSLIAALLSVYRQEFPNYVQVDCQQWAFHTTKGAQLMSLLAASDTTLATEAPAGLRGPLQVLTTPVFGGLSDTSDRTRYYPDMRRVLEVYLDAGGRNLERLEGIHRELQHSRDILSIDFGHLSYVQSLTFTMDFSQDRGNWDMLNVSSCSVDNDRVQVWCA
jgi:hypothetical protein